MRILFVASSLGNPVAVAWLYGLSSLGHDVAAVSDQDPVDTDELRRWGVRPDTVVLWRPTSRPEDLRREAVSALGGEPDVLFAWWGSEILQPLADAGALFPNAGRILCIDTFPSAAMAMSEARELAQFRKGAAWIDGYVYYSKTMRDRFHRWVPKAREAPYLTMIEPFPLPAFGEEGPQDGVPQLARRTDRPHVVFTGRPDRLFYRNRHFAKDAVGPFLAALAARGVEVFVKSYGYEGPEGLFHHYPHFSRQDLFEGRFSRYISQFDAHLVVYNEHNATIRRRVAAGLSTRLSFGVTTTSPIATTTTSAFVEGLWGRKPFGFSFSSIDELAERVGDTASLAPLRCNLRRHRTKFSFESQAAEVEQLLKAVAEGRA